ncbi:MAG: DUF4465 domain-containing protein [Planctomycetes bacterium]|nr:DUF4465 domain-containing protein [Planctomycetota bacterium]
MMWRNRIVGVVTAAVVMAGSLTAEVSSFEDVNLPPDSIWNGANGSGALQSGPASFENHYNADWMSWSGFAATSKNDPNVVGYDGQYNAVTGSGLLGSPTYGVSYASFPDPKIVLNTASPVQGLYLTNNTYAYFSMLEGDMFSKKFGGVDGNEPDWLKITFTGWDSNDTETGTVDFYLADFRFQDNSLDTILNHWAFADLSSLGEIGSLTLSLSSTDNGDWGMNTPGYVCVDNLVLADSAPYADPGVPGFDPLKLEAIHPVFRAWATDYVNYHPGLVSDAYATPDLALGEVTNDNLDVVSLGDLDADMIANDEAPGQITLIFGDPNDPNDPNHIRNEAGDDFVVFENGFISSWNVASFGSVAGQLLAELAFVEVSTNGVDFVRFPSISLVDYTLGAYGTLDPNRMTHLAGLHPNAYGDCFGTAFDLDALLTHAAVKDGLVDLQDIRFVRLVDIPGNGSFVDSAGHPIYDQWLTRNSGGFDLEAVGVLHAQVHVADINRDGIVDNADQTILDLHLDTSFGHDGWLSRTDLNGDFRTNALDLAVMDAQMGLVEAWREDTGK